MKKPSTNSFFVLVAVVFLSAVVSAQGPIQLEINNGRLNLLAEDRTFGEIIHSLADTAHFTTVIPPDVKNTRISIQIYGVSLDRAITRLFSLAQVKNYTVKYGTDGKIAQIKVVQSKGIRRGKPGQKISPQQRRPVRSSPKYKPPIRRPQKYQPKYVPPRRPSRNAPPVPDGGDQGVSEPLEPPGVYEEE